MIKAGPDVPNESIPRCSWCLATQQYIDYHDTEWGFPVDDDIRLFEKLSLEGFQSGLSWLTILKKREAFRAAFDRFDFRIVAEYTEADVNRLLQDAGIIRHRGKIEATINNARRMPELISEFGSLARYVWQFEPDEDSRPAFFAQAELNKLSKTPESVSLSKDLKKRGWKFVGPTTAYAFMQAMGLVNDHVDGCFARPIAEELRRSFRRP